MSTLEIIVLVGAAIGSLAYIIGVFTKLFKTWFKFINDWNGDNTEDNPGIVERLKQGNERFERIEADIVRIKAELFENGGSSLRDSIIRIEKNTTKKTRKP